MTFITQFLFSLPRSYDVAVLFCNPRSPHRPIRLPLNTPFSFLTAGNRRRVWLSIAPRRAPCLSLLGQRLTEGGASAVMDLYNS